MPRRGGSSPFIRTNDVFVQTIRTDNTKINQKINRIDFFLFKNNIKIIQNERMVLRLKIIKQELQFEECLKQRLEFNSIKLKK